MTNNNVCEKKTEVFSQGTSISGVISDVENNNNNIDVFKDDESYFVRKTTFRTIKYVTEQNKDNIRK